MTFRTWIKKVEKTYYKGLLDEIGWKEEWRKDPHFWDWVDFQDSEYSMAGSFLALNTAEAAVYKLSDKELRSIIKSFQRMDHSDFSFLWVNADSIYGAMYGNWDWEHFSLIQVAREKLMAITAVVIREPSFRMIDIQGIEPKGWERWRSKNLAYYLAGNNAVGFHYPED